ncbi:MAG: DUF4340 domain-containing protein, partial [Pseudomonadota bacterium]
MNRKTTIALILLVVLGGLAYLLMSRPEQGVRLGERPRPFPKITEKQVQTLFLAVEGEKTSIKREKDGWMITEPVKYRADKSTIDSIVEKITALEFGDLVTEQSSKHAELQVDEKTGIR